MCGDCHDLYSVGGHSAGGHKTGPGDRPKARMALRGMIGGGLLVWCLVNVGAGMYVKGVHWIDFGYLALAVIVAHTLGEISKEDEAVR